MISKPTFDIIEGIFHDGLGTYNELLVANHLIHQSNLLQQLYLIDEALSKIQKALDLLDTDDSKRKALLMEMQRIETGSVEVAAKILELIFPGKVTNVLHSAKSYAGGNASDLIIFFQLDAEEKTLPVSLKTDKSGKAALAGIGQTSNLYNWFEALFAMDKDEVDEVVSKIAPGLLLEDLQKNYRDIAHLVQKVFIDKLGLVDIPDATPTNVNNLSQARPTNLEAVKFLFEKVKYYSKGSDQAVVLVTNRLTGKVSTESTLDEVIIPTLNLKDVSLRPSKPKAGKAYSSEIGVKYKGKIVFTVQIKHRRGKTVTGLNKFYFHDITTRLALPKTP